MNESHEIYYHDQTFNSSDNNSSSSSVHRGFDDQSYSNDQYFSDYLSADATILNKHTYSTPGNAVSVKVVCINICGLLSKLRYPDFEQFCQSCDIVCLVETKLNSLDSFDVPNIKYCIR